MILLTHCFLNFLEPPKHNMGFFGGHYFSSELLESITFLQPRKISEPIADKSYEMNFKAM